MATVLYDTGINPSLIRARRVAVLGFGAQGRAQALNLKDSGVNVVVGLRAGSVSRAPAEATGLSVAEPAVAVSKADVVVLLVPDEKQPKLYADIIAPGLRKQGALIFAHGFNIHFKRIVPRADLDVILVAPNGIGEQVRAQYLEDHGVPALVAAHQDASGRARELALSYAWAQGHGRAGIIESSFREEAETDLFAEQAVLCGGLTHLIQAAFDTLVQAGYEPEVAYFACLHEVKLMADMIFQHGIAGMRESISTTAEFGDYTRGPRVIGEPARKAMREILAEIQNGQFAGELEQELAAGLPAIKVERVRARAQLIEKVGKTLRERMRVRGRSG
ncbi:MAG: ketol-acid reductoisomerase [Gammaproteobacteria bacterium]|nr:ketol-acid reductoisomerase [Gammaproteobacteria bacterium]MBU6509877.1 ketol-acid reductoisomerase [Gammaproteobacteria bacterium]MDE1984209.1 ketol-acid reductoisomerase [Gammaproteobacteria bacterium]MDE2108479.1 ketol-acid reductoisomerase [Gammaproteobacteria bacterium]MDE2460777.1 ketol-acid reductoisomerase [Gammaproteobacteria bacterium]